MITINNLKYNKYETKISWGKFSVNSFGEKRTGISPFILFHANNTFIGLELTFSKEMFENLEIGIQTDIKKYISDITFEDEKGWISIIDDKYDCNITKIDEKRFHIDFNVVAYDFDEQHIYISDDIKIL